MMELEGREPGINTPPHLSEHANGIHEKDRRNQVRRYDKIWH
jgi:hypothetical protein